MNSYREAAGDLAAALRAVMVHGYQFHDEAAQILGRFDEFNAPDRQASLFPKPTTPARPYVAQDTSIQAAKALSMNACDTIEGAVYRLIESRGDRGATDQEIATALHIHEGTCRARRVSLTAQAAVCDSGHRRKTRSGRDAIVWISR